MRFRTLFILAAMLLCSVSLASAQSISLESVDGVSPSDAEVLQSGTDITFYLRFTNGADVLKGITNGYRVYSDDGVTWTPATIVHTGVITNTMFDGGVFATLNSTGSGADTVGLGGFAMFAGGIQPGFDEVYGTIGIGSLSAGDAGKTICLDSSWYPPSGIWKWASVSADIFPTWDGPHCYYIDTKPAEAALVSITPNSSTEGMMAQTFTIVGASTTFTDNALAVNLGGTLVPTSVNVVSDTELEATFDFPCGTTTGVYDVNVTYTGASLTLPGAFTINPAPAANMSVSTNQINFAVCEGGPAPDGNFFLVNSDACPFDFTAAETADWLTIDPTSGTSGATVNVSVDPTGLAAGVYNADITVTAEVGNSPQTVAVQFTVNPLPVIACPADPIDETICGSQEICVALPIADANEVTVDGATWVDGQLCFTPAVSGEYVFNVTATNDCGSDQCAVTVNVTIAQPPVITCPDPTTIDIFQCELGPVEIDLPVTGATLVDATPGVWADGVLSFNPATAGSYPVHVVATNDCGETTCDFSVLVSVGGAPTITCPDLPFYHGMCEDETTACFPLEIAGAASVEITGDPSATWDAGQLCFTPDTSGQYFFSVTATSDCGIATCENIEINITKGTIPTVTCFDDFSTFINESETCLPVTIESVFGYNYSELIVGGEGLTAVFNTQTDEFCYTAPTAGEYPVTLIIGNGCGNDTCQFIITVEECPLPVITCPAEPTAVELCELGEVCVDLPITGADEVTASTGTWVDGSLCFTPVEGENTVTVTATNACGEATCDVIVNVSLTPMPIIGVTDPYLATLCEPIPVCLDVPVENATTVLVSDGFTWDAGQLCFTPDTAGIYEATITASNACHEVSETQSFVVDYIPAPTAGFDVDTDTGMMPFTPTFTNTSTGTGLTYAWDFGDGGTSTDFEPMYTFDMMGDYLVTLTVTDECDHVDEYSMTIYVLDNEIVVPTDEWIVAYCAEPMLEGSPMMPGDVIKAYDPDGVLCGKDVVKEDGSFGMMNIYHDDPYTLDVDEGAVPGDVITFAVNGMVVATNPTVIWTENGDVYEVCDFVAESCMTFELSEGWNLISWNVAFSSDMESFIAEYADCIDVILSFDQQGLTYDPMLPQFSTLNGVDFYHGYWFRLSCPISLEICGGVISPSDYIQVYSGWNLVSYWPDYSMPVVDGFASIMENLQVAYGYDDGAMDYVPGDALHNTLTDLYTGFGYWVKSSAADMLIYGDVPVATKSEITSLASADRIAASRDWMSLYGAGIKLDGQELANGSTIEVFTEDGVLCGSGTYSGGLLKFTPVYGNDVDFENYPQVDDQLTIHINGAAVEQEVTYVGGGARVALASLTSGAPVPGGFTLAQNYPNPFNPTTSISFNLTTAGQVELSIFNIMGQKVTTLADGVFSAGTHEVEWNGTDENGNLVTSGVYFYRIAANDNSQTRKMILMK